MTIVQSAAGYTDRKGVWHNAALTSDGIWLDLADLPKGLTPYSLMLDDEWGIRVTEN